MLMLTDLQYSAIAKQRLIWPKPPPISLGVNRTFKDNTLSTKKVYDNVYTQIILIEIENVDFMNFIFQ